MCKAWPALPLYALLCLAPPTVPLAAPPDQQCRELAARYAPRYRLAVDQGFRAVKMKGRPTPVVVWGGERTAAPAAAAAAALLHAALRYGLGYDVELRLQQFDACTADDTQLAVAPAAAIPRCREDQYQWLVRLLARDSTALVPLGAALLARAPARCARDGLLPAYHRPTLSSCAASLTLLDFRKLKSELPACNFNVRGCSPHEDPLAHVVLAAAPTPPLELDRLLSLYPLGYVCKNNISLTFLLFNSISCFDRTVRHLDAANLSFLLLDRNLEMYAPGLLPVALQAAADARCPARDLHNATDLVHRVGDGPLMRRYAPQIADVVQTFCPSFQNLKDVLRERPGDALAVERATCEWALQNGDTFESWIARPRDRDRRRRYGLYCYICRDDRLNEEYKKVIEVVRAAMTPDDFDVSVHPIEHDCRGDHGLEEIFSSTILSSPRYVMGAVAWSSSGGVEAVARSAARQRVPLVLAGPAPPPPPPPLPEPAAAIDGTLDDLAYLYRAFLTYCGWTRMAVLSDGSTYAKAFTDRLLRGPDLVYVDATVTPATATDVLKSLRADEARIFIVNTNSSMAVEIIQCAVTLGMTPPNYAWIVREWSPLGERVAAAGWGDMTHVSLGTAWRGGPGGAAGVAAGDAALRARLGALWPGAAWPALAAPLADAMLLLYHSFIEFHRLYSTNSHSMRHGEYALSFVEIYDKIKVAGVGRELSFRNGTVETLTGYLERWRGASRVALVAWELQQGRPLRAEAEGACGARVRDWPRCSFPAGGRGFAQRCYDVPLYALLAALALLPPAAVAARRARLRRLARRDLNLLAHVLEGERLAPIVGGESLHLHRKIGTGNFGSVYLATLRRSKERAVLVAAKELRDESDKREYLQEAGTLQRVDHENIVKFVGICLSNGSLLILMEYALHGDLLQYLRARRGPGGEVAGEAAGEVSAAELTRLAREAGAALGYLARCGVVHRDVRAANCLLDAHRTLKLADFGLARTLRDDLEYTSTRRTVLPVLWLAPESLRGVFSPASDVWSLGVLLLELVTLGARPYGACPPLLVLAHVRRGGHPPLPPDLTPQAASLMMACWQHKAAERATATELQRYLASQPLALRRARLPAPDIAPDLAPDFAPDLAPDLAPDFAPDLAPVIATPGRPA